MDIFSFGEARIKICIAYTYTHPIIYFHNDICSAQCHRGKRNFVVILIIVIMHVLPQFPGGVAYKITCSDANAIQCLMNASKEQFIHNIFFLKKMERVLHCVTLTFNYEIHVSRGSQGIFSLSCGDNVYGKYMVISTRVDLNLSKLNLKCGIEEDGK